MLVEVDVELIEAGNFAALGGTDGVVGQVDKDAKQLMLNTIVVLTNQALELLGGMDSTDIQRGSQFRFGIVDAPAVHVTCQKHHVDQMGRAEKVRRAGTLVFLTGIHGGGDDRLGVDEVVAEVFVRAGALKIASGGSDVYIVVDGIEIVVVPDRADMILRDLHLIPGFAAIANHYSKRDLFVEVLLHHAVLILDHVEIGDVYDVVTVQRVDAVYSLRVGSPADHVHVAARGFALTLLVAMTADTLIAGVHLAGTDAADGGLTNLLHDHVNPSLVTGEQFRGTRAQILVIREQALDVVDAVLKLVVAIGDGLLGINSNSGSQTANIILLGQTQDLALGGMAQRGIPSLFFVENIVLHVVVSSFGFVRFVIIFPQLFRNSGDESIHNGLLLFGHTVDYILNGFIVF